MEKELLNLEETAKKYNKTEQELKDMIENGDLYFKVINGVVMIPTEQLERN